MAMQQYSDRLRLYRRQLHSVIGTATAMHRFTDLLDTQTHWFLYRLLKSPHRLVDHVKRYDLIYVQSANR